MEKTSKFASVLKPNPQSLAWLVVLSSFVLFCGACAGSAYAAFWFFFQSPVTLTTHLIVSKGTVTVIRSDLTSYAVSASINQSASAIGAQTILQTDANAQAYLSIEDSFTGKVVANVFLLANSSLSFQDASRPRFDWSGNLYTILLSDATGHFAIDMTKEAELNRASSLMLRSSAGVAQIVEGGSYTIDALDEQLTLYTESGKGVLYASPANARQVDSTMQGTLKAGQITIQPYPLIMLDLPDPGPIVNSFDQPPDMYGGPPPNWTCVSDQDDQSEPSGRSSWTKLDEEMVFELSRKADRPLGHAETSCEFLFPDTPDNPYGLDVTDYTSLAVRIKMKIIDQDVTTCGVAGSECPVMLELDYVDTQNNIQKWYQGFYSERPPSDTSVLRCDSCHRDHDQINEGAWYIFDTGNLRNQPPFNVKTSDSNNKVYITKIRIYASGHRYDAALNEVSVLGIPAPVD